ncbi:hypothetical protein [Streptomyces sp. NPDC053431]|uniref:hypothetical protein n=1 Tax=Streptomyces sp. NPDC053431 TaxID=3365703 RepID=UPI0037D03C42
MTMHLPQLRTLAIPVLFAFTTLMVAAGHAHAETIDPVGIGDLLPSPKSAVPAGPGTLYETYSNPNLWTLDSDYGKFDVLDPMAESIADVCMVLIAVIGTGIIVVIQWIFQLTSVPELEGALAGTIGGAAKGLSTTLLPAALAVGALVAFAKHREGGGSGGMSQIAWVFVSGIVSVSLLSTPQVWVDGVDTTRQVGASIALNATAGGIAEGRQEYPFALEHEPQYAGNGRDDMLRKSSDSVWRSYVATPWCLAEFGSLKACEQHGKDLLDQGSSKEKRKAWLKEHVDEEAVGPDSVTWRQGHSPMGRIAVTVPALIVLLIFAVLVVVLAFASLASLIGVLMLLVAGVVFACLWVIPGRPRQWGLRWFDQLLGLTLQSFVATMTLGCVLVVQVATTKMFAEYQWAPSAGLSIAAAVMAFKFRKIMEAIVGVSGATSSPLSTMLGMMATRTLHGGKRGPGQHNRPVRTLGGSGGPADGDGGGGGGEGGDDDGPTGPGGAGLPARIAFRPRRPLPGDGQRAVRIAELADQVSRNGPTSVAGAPASIPDDSTRQRQRTRVGGPGPLPLRATADLADPIGAGGSDTASAAEASAVSFRRAPAPNAPGPRAIEARVVRSSTPPSPAPQSEPAQRQRATQPPPPARRAAPARRPAPSRPAPRRAAPAGRPDVPAAQEG